MNLNWMIQSNYLKEYHMEALLFEILELETIGCSIP